MAWFKKEKYTTLKPPTMRDRIPEGLWTKCDNCYEIIVASEFHEALKVCRKCNHHHPLRVNERVNLLVDGDTWQEMFTEVQPTDPLNFTDEKPYAGRLKAAQAKAGCDEAVKCGVGEMNGRPFGLAAMAFEFIGGSMGSVVGERITRLVEHATAQQLPVIIVSASGGARMHEGILSLMQMAKTSGALARHAEAGLPFISLLTHPTTGGVTASFAMLGDVIIAEPDALIGFAGPRVIQQTINQILPKGFQKSDFVMQHGFLDLVVERKDLKDTIALLLNYMMFARDKAAGRPNALGQEAGGEEAPAEAAAPPPAAEPAAAPRARAANGAPQPKAAPAAVGV